MIRPVLSSLLATVLVVAGCATTNTVSDYSSSSEMATLLNSPHREVIPVPEREGPAASQMTEMLLPYRTEVAKWESVIGSSDVTMLVEDRTHILGPWVADMISAELTRLGKPVDVTLVNAGGVRSTLNKGQITYRDIASILPFENTLVVYTVEKEKLDVIATKLAETSKWNCLSGMVIWHTNEGKLVKYTVGGEAPVDGRTYTFATNNYLAAGGGGFDFWADWPQEENPVLLRDVVADHIRHMTTEGKAINLPTNLNRFIVVED